MVYFCSVRHLALATMLVAAARGQPGSRRDASPVPAVSSTPTPASSASLSSSSTTAAPAGYTTAVVPIYLFDIAESLLSQYFPSTIPADLAAVKWPSTVVLGTATYALHEKSTSTSSHQTATPTQSSHSQQNSDQKGNETLAIVLATVIGAIAIAIMVVIFCCLRRRKKRTGTMFMRRSSPSTSTRGSRRANVFGGNTEYIPNGNMGHAEERDTTFLTGAHVLPPSSHAHHHRELSDESPFYTPQEPQASHRGRHGIMDQTELQNQRSALPSNPQGTGATHPSDAFAPSQLRKPIPPHRLTDLHTNPFSSAEDREADDVVSPILPSKSSDRMNSPLVHYPSVSEVSEFDFAGRDGESGAVGRGNSGAWRSGRERLDGRHELA